MGVRYNGASIKASIDILINGNNRNNINVYDVDAGVCIIELTLTDEQLAMALSRLSRTPVEKCDVYNMDIVGKKQIYETWSIIIKDSSIRGYGQEESKEKIRNIIKEDCPEGYIPDLDLSSQGSINYTDKDTIIVTTMIRKWVDKL